MWTDKLNQKHSSTSCTKLLIRLMFAPDYFTLWNPQNFDNSWIRYKKYPQHLHYSLRKCV